MKKKLQVTLTTAASAALLAGLVAGCGSSSGGSSSNSGNTGNSTSTQKTLPTGQTITIWSWAGGVQLTDLNAMAQAWAKAHGDTVKVVDQSKNPNGFQFFATAARTGKGPDIVFGMPHDNNGAFAQAGLLASVPSGVLNTSDLNQAEIDALTVNGTQYSLPVSVQTTALFYNKALVPNPPTNWNDFVTDANAHGFGYDQANLYFNYAFIGGFGGYVFKNNNGTLDTKDIGLNNSGAVQAFTLMHDMVAKYHWMTTSTTGAIANSQFTAGKLGMYIDGPWDIPTFNKVKGLNYGIAPLPTLSNGQSATPFMGVITTFVSSKSPKDQQDADWSLAEAISGSDAQNKYFADAQQIPAFQSLLNAPAIQNDQYFKAMAAQLKTAVPMPNIPQMQAVWTAMSVITNIINGKVTPQQGADDFVANIKKGIQVQGN